MEIRERIIKIMESYSEMENVAEYLQSNDDLTKLEMNSINFIKMVVDLEDEFNFEFEDSALDYSKFSSLNVLCEYVKEQMG